MKERLFLPKIRELRTGLGLTQVQLCDAIGFPRASYSRFENGERPVPLEFVDMLARFYRIPPSTILEHAVWIKGDTK